MRAKPSGAVTAQYLERYATVDARLANALTERYEAALVVPAYREAPGLLQRYRAALASAAGRVLVIVVVNASRSRALDARPVHEELLADLRAGRARRLALAPEVWLSRREHCDVLSIDRSHPEHCLPDGEGVGLARRIGCDLALGLYAAGRLGDPFLYCTDADAELPVGYFGARPRAEGSEEHVGLCFPFWHEPGGDRAIDAATALYELGLRYYVNGLSDAGSPFAFHTLGSALAIRAPAYAVVRGFPRRLAGEDFYLLNKLAKVGLVGRVDLPAIRLLSRASERTAHGTGVAATKLAAAGTHDVAFYHPGCFVALAAWLHALGEFSRSGQLEPARRVLSERAGEMERALSIALQELGAWPALAEAATRGRGPRVLEARSHTWFDAFRTLKLVHALRRHGAASLPFRDALEGSPCPSALARQGSVDQLRDWFARRESQQAPCLGIGRDGVHPGSRPAA